ncbi:PAS domain-containing sensor histidine kinase [Mangrovicella endophytica]|uniref:PAS domain-containing sensor histidine kinase n=1 Tax=Mangrovicella endophytica TaxID=2066697 RepID=UPI000C9E60C5|nr:PAS domain-containing sensor histidine kinase [Mangrovicella endophytica]
MEKLTSSFTEDDRYRILIEAVTDYAIYMLDAGGHVTSWNPGARRFKGYEEAEILGAHFSRFYTDEDRAIGLPATALKTAAEQGKFESEGWRVRKDGQRFWAYVIIDPIRDADGQLVGFAKVTRDLTERKKAREELDAAREALFQSQKIEALGQLTGGIAHDFNNLLMAVLGSLELVQKRIAPDPRISPLIENAISGAQRGAALTKRLLAFARRQDLEYGAVHLPVLISGMAGLLQRSIGSELVIETRFPLILPAVHTDANQMELALLNLLVNARDATEGRGHVIIAARREDLATGNRLQLPPGAYVCLSVKDDGKGMDEVTLQRATEPFFTTKGVGKGTGLGLPMVHGLAEQSGGRLVLRSRKGEGTTVEVWLPIAEEGEAQADLESEPAAELVPVSPEQPALRILAVDDDPLVLMNTAVMLQELGHTVRTAASGREAIEMLASEEVDLLITDHAMPDMTGSELAEHIGATHPDITIVLASGYAELTAKENAGLPLLKKPFLLRDLDQIIGKALATRRGPSIGSRRSHKPGVAAAASRSHPNV